MTELVGGFLLPLNPRLCFTHETEDTYNEAFEEQSGVGWASQSKVNHTWITYCSE